MTKEEIRLAESSRRKKHWKRRGSTSVNVHGAPCVKTTARTGTPGNICHTTMRVHAPIAGTKTAWPGSVIVGK